MLSAALAAHLAALGLARWAGTGPADAPPVCVEELPDTPDAVIGVITRPGLPPDPVGGWAWPEVQVIVRHPGDTTGRARPGLTLARRILAALHGTTRLTWAAGTPDEVWVLTCTAQSSEPVALGPDVAGRRRWSVTYELEIQATGSPG